MSKQANKLKSIALAVGLAMAGIGSAQAVTITQGLVNGQNDLVDESRETYVDANTNGLFDAGDVIFGYIRISDFQPAGNSGNNQVYGVFSQQVSGFFTNFIGTFITFAPTTVAGLTLADLLGDASISASAMAAFYDRPTSYVDLINSNPPGPPADMTGYISYIKSNGTRQVVAGFSDADDFLQSQLQSSLVLPGGPNGAIPTVPSSITLTGNVGALSILENNTTLVFNDVVPVLRENPIPFAPSLVLAEVAVSSGTTAGAAGSSVLPQPKNWLEAGGPYAQCATAAGDVACGFTNKNNFTVNVTIPEPGSLALLSAALLGVAGFARRRKSLPV